MKTAMKTSHGNETIVIEDDERYDYVNLRGPSSTTQPLFHRLYVIIWARLLFNSVLIVVIFIRSDFDDFARLSSRSHGDECRLETKLVSIDRQDSGREVWGQNLYSFCCAYRTKQLTLLQ